MSHSMEIYFLTEISEKQLTPAWFSLYEISNTSDVVDVVNSILKWLTYENLKSYFQLRILSHCHPLLLQGHEHIKSESSLRVDLRDKIYNGAGDMLFFTGES